MIDVEKWPLWTESISEVKRIEAGEFGVGSTARIKAKGAPTAVWRVTELTPGRSFTWETTRPPRMIASHVIEAKDGGSRVTLAVESSGIVGTILGPFMKGMTTRNVRMEAEGLKRISESG
jgi:hypothetical protein